MNISMEEKAGILTRALPYIQKYNGKILVVKYGGNAMVSEELKESVMSDIILLSTIGIKVVLVHGGGPEITGMLNKIGKKSEFVNGLRVTDKETADVVQMVLAGKINKSLVNLLCARGGKAIGLSGSDGGMIKAKPKAAELGYVGEITDINVQPILDVIEMGYIPVISTVGFDDDGNTYNINADTVAADGGGNGMDSLVLSDDVTVHICFDFLRGREGIGKLQILRFTVFHFVAQDARTKIDALVADIYIRTGNNPVDLFLPLAAERAADGISCHGPSPLNHSLFARKSEIRWKSSGKEGQSLPCQSFVISYR